MKPLTLMDPSRHDYRQGFALNGTAYLSPFDGTRAVFSTLLAKIRRPVDKFDSRVA